MFKLVGLCAAAAIVVFTAQATQLDDDSEARIVDLPTMMYPTEPGDPTMRASQSAVVEYETGRVCTFVIDDVLYSSLSVNDTVLVNPRACTVNDWHPR